MSSRLMSCDNSTIIESLDCYRNCKFGRKQFSPAICRFFQ
ncbi:hypothetical protein X946_5060 [Burkholderia sp. ABCPW 111]|nr:hypothetical protein X946_5060 [Burkholderia sp. ABCPW 111]